MLTIDWVTDNRDQARTSAFETRYGHVDGARRFKIEHWTAPDGGTFWRAFELPEPGDTFDGTYDLCVDWCWRRGQ